MEKAISMEHVYLRYDHHNAESILKDINFSVEKGEVFGIIGINGSGKTTILRLLAGLMSPDSGRIETYGNTVSLMALGIGFHNDLSGKDNIYLSGLLMGFTKKEIDQHYRKIVEFSELEDYIDKPVNTYSSGMRSKLAFSVSINLRVDILLIDEVLSVGDMRFKKKSRYAMERLIKNNKLTVIMVSHNQSDIKEMCDRVMWINEGRVEDIGEPGRVLEHYHHSIMDSINSIIFLETPVVTIVSESDGIQLKWNNIENAIDYKIYRKECYKGSRWIVIAEGWKGNEYTDIPPSDEMKYLYTVKARADNGYKDVWSEFIPTTPISVQEK